MKRRKEKQKNGKRKNRKQKERANKMSKTNWRTDNESPERMEQILKALEMDQERKWAKEEAESYEKECSAAEEAKSATAKQATATPDEESGTVSSKTCWIHCQDFTSRRWQNEKEEETTEWQCKALAAQEDLEKTKEE